MQRLAIRKSQLDGQFFGVFFITDENRSAARIAGTPHINIRIANEPNRLVRRKAALFQRLIDRVARWLAFGVSFAPTSVTK